MVVCTCLIIRATSFVKITNIMNRIRYVLVSLDFITCSECSYQLPIEHIYIYNLQFRIFRSKCALIELTCIISLYL